MESIKKQIHTEVQETRSYIGNTCSRLKAGEDSVSDPENRTMTSDWERKISEKSQETVKNQSSSYRRKQARAG